MLRTISEALTGTRYPIEDRTHLPVPDTGRGRSLRSRCRLQPSRCESARIPSTSRAGCRSGRGSKCLRAMRREMHDGTQALSKESTMSRSSLLNGSCDGAGEKLCEMRRIRLPSPFAKKGLSCHLSALSQSLTGVYPVRASFQVHYLTIRDILLSRRPSRPLVAGISDRLDLGSLWPQRYRPLLNKAVLDRLVRFQSVEN